MLADVITSRFPLADVTLLLRAGADADGPVTRGLRPLHYAAYENDVDVAEVLIAGGADVNATDDLGYTPLHIATRHGHVEAARCLLDHGAAVNHGLRRQRLRKSVIGARCTLVAFREPDTSATRHFGTTKLVPKCLDIHCGAKPLRHFGTKFAAISWQYTNGSLRTKI